MEHTMRESHIADFCRLLHQGEHSPATLEKYARTLHAFYSWLPAEKTVDKETVQGYKAALSARYAPASVNSMLAALRSFFRARGWTDCDVKLLKIQRRVFAAREKELSRNEYERLVAAAKKRGSRRLSLLLEIMASTGLRVSELRYITVEAARQGRAEISMKGKVRVILLPGKLCRKLLNYAEREKTASGQIIRTRSGRPMNRKEIWAQLKNLSAAAGVEPGKVFPHNLRRLFARVFYAAQRDIAKLADLLGHSSVETTRIYLLSSGEEHLKKLESLGLVS